MFQLCMGVYFRKWEGPDKEGHNGFLWGLIE
jgi:hypothetical protein